VLEAINEIEMWPSVLVLPNESERFAKFLSDEALTIRGVSSRMASELEARYALIFKEIERANSVFPYSDAVDFIASVVWKGQVRKSVQVARQARPLDGDEFRAPSTIALLARKRRMAPSGRRGTARGNS